MLKKLPKRKLRKTVTFARAAKKQPRIDAVSLTEQEIAVSKALTALCGGSGVGQAPELPQRAVQLTNEVDFIYLPKAPEYLQFRDYFLLHTLYIREVLFGKSEKILTITDKKQEKKEELRIEDREFAGPMSRRINPGVRKVVRRGVGMVSYLLIILAVIGFGFTYGPVIKAEIGYQIKNQITRSQDSKKEEKYRAVLKPTEIAQIEPGKVKGAETSKLEKLPETAKNEFDNINFVADISIAIPKIDAYAEIFPNVNPAVRDEYLPVLQKGVAHALGTAMPGEVGNVYLFAHSAGNAFDIARFNAVFYLISKLENGDKIYLKFGDKKFAYTVYDKKEVDASETSYINNRKDNGRMLTLQTCTPPGTDWRRLLVFAKIEE